MIGKVVLASVLFLFSISQAAVAQMRRAEITPTFGYTFSEGVRVNDVDIGDGTIVRRVDPESGLSYGIEIDLYFRYDGMIGFLWNQQGSDLLGEVRGEGTKSITDMKIDTFHAIFTYIRNDLHPVVSPFVFGGLGGTRYSFDNILGSSVESDTRFSTTWGAGFEVHTSETIGLKFTGRWTPTYIKTDADGIWCSPYYCWVIRETDYSHQFELSAGLVFGL